MVKLFAHRGFTFRTYPAHHSRDYGQVLTKAEQNTIASLKNAILAKFRAVEFDIWFFDEKLVLKHDKPEISELNNLPILKDYFIYGNDLEYWLDFKNLDEKNISKVLNLVKEEIDLAKINLEKIYFAPFITEYEKVIKIFSKIRNLFGEKVNLVAVCEELKNNEDIEKLKNFLNENNIKFLSIFHKLLNENFVKEFNKIEFFAWTVNDLERVFELEKLGIKNFATDNITPQIYDEKS
jgi:glycerophosphoryl diester phosphodiesterase